VDFDLIDKHGRGDGWAVLTVGRFYFSLRFTQINTDYRSGLTSAGNEGDTEANSSQK